MILPIDSYFNKTLSINLAKVSCYEFMKGRLGGVLFLSSENSDLSSFC